MRILDRLLATAENVAARVVSAARPARVTYTQLGATNVSTWTLESVKRALDSHETGWFTESAQLLDAMGRDDRISGCLRSRCKALTSKGGTPFAVEQPEDATGWVAKRAVKDVSRLWWDVIPDATLTRAMRDTVGIGVHISKINYVNTDGMWIPRLQPWDPQNIHCDEQTGKYYAQTTTGEVEVTIGDGQWFVYAPEGERSYMGGAVRCLGFPYLARGWTYRDWARFCERHGIPILAIREPASAKDNEKKSFYERVRTLGREGILRLPQSATKDGVGWGVDIVEAKDATYQAFKDFKAALDVDVAVALLGQNLTTEPGQQQQGVTGAREVKREYLASDAESFSTATREQIWKPFGRFNYAGWDDSYAPWGRWDCSPPDDKLKRAQTMVQVADAVTKLVNVGMPVDGEAIAERFDIPLQDGEPIELSVPKPAPQAPPLPPANEGEEQEDDSAEEGEEQARHRRGRSVEHHHARALGTSAPSGALVEGQAYVDAVQAKAAAQGAETMKPIVESLLREIEASTSKEDLEKRLAAWYAGNDVSTLVTTLERGAIMTELAGRYSVLRDL